MVDSVSVFGTDSHADPAVCIEQSGQLFVGNSDHWCKFETGTVPLSISNRDTNTAFAVEEASEPRIEIVGLG
jgi:hypothetical protein